MPTSKVYIAGTGSTPLKPSKPSSSSSSSKSQIASLVSAATKALLDAGVTYDDVSQSLTTKGSKSSAETFKGSRKGDAAVEEVETGREFEKSSALVGDRGARCVLVVVAEKSAALAFVLVSESFLRSRPYLRESAILVRKSDSKSNGQASESLQAVCKTVWALRGWTQSNNKTSEERQTSYKGFELSRADNSSVPEWKDVEHRQDGKHRLGYNPAAETKEISRENFEAVRASGEASRKVDGIDQFSRKGGDRAALARL